MKAPFGGRSTPATVADASERDRLTVGLFSTHIGVPGGWRHKGWCPLCALLPDTGADPALTAFARKMWRDTGHPQPSEGWCQRCGAQYPVWVAPDDLWNQVAEDQVNGLVVWHFLCPGCFATLAEEREAVPPTTVWSMAPKVPVCIECEHEWRFHESAGDGPPWCGEPGDGPEGQEGDCRCTGYRDTP